MPGYSQDRERSRGRERSFLPDRSAGGSAGREAFTKVTAAPSYKEPLSLKRFITDRGKLVPAKRTGASAKMQRVISREVKRARFMALLPYTDRHAI